MEVLCKKEKDLEGIGSYLRPARTESTSFVEKDALVPPSCCTWRFQRANLSLVMLFKIQSLLFGKMAIDPVLSFVKLTCDGVEGEEGRGAKGR